MTSVEQVPAIKKLNELAAKISPECREELYKIVASFLDWGTTPGLDALIEYQKYLLQKAKEGKPKEMSDGKVQA